MILKTEVVVIDSQVIVLVIYNLNVEVIVIVIDLSTMLTYRAGPVEKYLGWKGADVLSLFLKNS